MIHFFDELDLKKKILPDFQGLNCCFLCQLYQPRFAQRGRATGRYMEWRVYYRRLSLRSDTAQIYLINSLLIFELT